MPALPLGVTLSALVLAASALCTAQTITTVAGNGTEAFGGDGGPATKAWISQPNGVAVDKAGNIYFADTRNIRVRKVTPAGIISTLAGDGTIKLQIAGANIGDGGPATSAGFSPSPSLFQGIAVDAAGNVYISDAGNRRVRRVNPEGMISTFAGGGTGGDGGQATAASLALPGGLAVDAAGNLYIADSQGGKIRKVTPGGIISTVAGNGSLNSSGDGGPATQAGIGNPLTVAVDKEGNLYLTEQTTFRVRKVNSSGIISTVAGSTIGFAGDDGPATGAKFGDLRGLAADNAGNLYIADYGNNRVRKLDSSGTITTVAGIGTAGIFLENGDGGLAINSRLSPSGLALDEAGNLFVSDYVAARVRKIDFKSVPPGLSVSVGSLAFASNPNSAPASQTIKVSSAGPPLAFRVAAAGDIAGNPWMTVSTATGTTPQTMTVSIRSGLAPGTYDGAITVTPVTSGYDPVTVPVRVTINAAVPPTPMIASVVSGASFEPGVVPNSFLTIKGTNLASTTDTWDRFIAGGKLPTSLGGVIVTFNGMPAYISYVSPAQINLLAPDTGIVSLRIFVNNNGASSTVFSIGAAATGPAFFSWPGSQVVATRVDYTYAAKSGTFSSPTVAAKPGDVLILWGTGFGPTTPPVLPGGVTPADQTYATSTLPAVTINNIPATVYGAALASGYAGLYQIAIQVPATIPDGDWPVIATIGGIPSPNGLMLAVRR
jgi:uncharacterized protein (TIGR03437 family)